MQVKASCGRVVTLAPGPGYAHGGYHRLEVGPRGRWLASTSWHKLTVWDTTTRTRRPVLRTRARSGSLVRFDPRGRYMALLDGEQLTLYALPGFGVLKRWKATYEKAITGCGFDPRGRWLVMAKKTREVERWALPSLRRDGGWRMPPLGGSFDRPRPRLTFHPDGKHGLIGYGSLQLWDLAAGRHVVSLAIGMNRKPYTVDVLVHDPKGFVDGKGAGRHLARWGPFMPWSLAWDRYRVPRLLERALAGDTSYRLTHLRALLKRP